jgi:hypothetical protein
MRRRIALWAMVGFLISAGWTLYSFSSVPSPLADHPLLLNLAIFTQPVALLSFYVHFGVRFYWVLLANAATYGLLGYMVESLRGQLRRAT